jgi:hypothetical protein
MRDESPGADAAHLEELRQALQRPESEPPSLDRLETLTVIRDAITRSGRKDAWAKSRFEAVEDALIAEGVALRNRKL